MAWALLLQGWALVVEGQNHQGIDQIKRGLRDSQDTGGKVWKQYHLALLAEAYGHHEQADAGLQILTEGFAEIEQTGQHHWESELYRLQGDLLLTCSTADHAAAASSLRQALDVARRQQAKSLELRAAVSLARLWQSQGKRQAAYDLLAPVYNWFTEGFETADLQNAKTLLTALETSTRNL